MSLSRRQDNIDGVSQVLAQGVPPGVPKSYRALADHGNVPRSTLHHRARGRPSMEAIPFPLKDRATQVEIVRRN